MMRSEIEKYDAQKKADAKAEYVNVLYLAVFMGGMALILWILWK